MTVPTDNMPLLRNDMKELPLAGLPGSSQVTTTNANKYRSLSVTVFKLQGHSYSDFTVYRLSPIAYDTAIRPSNEAIHQRTVLDDNYNTTVCDKYFPVVIIQLE